MNEPFDLPEMLDPTDVCSAMDDLAFMEYCYSHFDVNHDHKVGLHEARAVREIDLSDSKVVSLRGIEYFSNLERLILDRSTVRELHLLQNTKLKEISAKGCAHLNLTKLPNGLSAVPNNEIWYTSTDGKIVEPHNADAFGANIVSNTYENGKGIISFDGEVTSIGSKAFYERSSLTSILIPDSVTTIGKDAFYGCTSLTSITIPDSVTSIGDSAFFHCTSLTSITIPDSVTEIGKGAFEKCYSLTSFYGKCASEDGRCLIVDSTLISFAPAGITEYTIPDSVTSIGSSAFHGCTSLTSVTIPDSVTEIGEWAFSGCKSLRSITIPDSVTTIGDSAFCCTSLRSITIPDSVTLIGNYAFWNCISLISVTIPDSVTSIGMAAFFGCTSLTSVTIPDSVTSIGGYAFRDCTSLKSIAIPDSVTSIECEAFRGCTSLTSITIPDSVTEIGRSAFCGCTSLKEVFCKPMTPPTSVGLLEGLTFEVFDGCSSNCKIYVPRQSVEAYKSAKGLKEYANAIVGYDFEAEKKSVAVEQMDKSPYYLFFDTETTGLPKNFKAPASETYNWPRMVQLAWIVANKQGDILKKKSCIIRPEGYTISSSAAEVHGITTAIAQEKGLPLYFVLNVFGEDLAAAKVLVAHNMAFDKKIVHAEYIRLGCEDVWTNGPTERICTMMSSIDYCALPGFYDD